MSTWKAVCLGLTGAFGLIALALFAYSLQGGVPISQATEDQHQEGNYKITLRCGDANVEIPIGTFTDKEGFPVQTGGWSDTPSELKCDKDETDTKDVTISNNGAKWNGLTVDYNCPKNELPIRELVIEKVVLGQRYPLPNCPDANPPPPNGPPPPTPTPTPQLGKSPSITIKSADVGGIAELPEVAGTPLETAGSSGSNTGVLAGFAAAIAAGTVTLGGAAWYARRRFIRS